MKGFRLLLTVIFISIVIFIVFVALNKYVLTIWPNNEYDIHGVYSNVRTEEDYLSEETKLIKTSKPIGEITKDVVIKQYFEVKEDFMGIRIVFATYGRENTSDITFELFEDGSNKLMYSETFNSNTLTDNKPKLFYFDKIGDFKNKRYYFTLTSRNATLDNCVTVWGNDSLGDLSSKLYINNDEINSSIVFSPIHIGNKIDAFPEITKNTIISQYFKVYKPYFSGVELNFLTFKRKNTSNLIFSLYSNDNRLICMEGVNIPLLKDGETVKFKFKPIKNLEGQKYYFTLQSTNALPNNAVTVNYNSLYSLDSNDLYVNDEKVNGSLVFTTITKTYPNIEYWNIFVYISEFAILLMVLTILGFIVKKLKYIK